MIRVLFLLCPLVLCMLTAGAQESAWESNLALNYTFGGWDFNSSTGHRSIKEKVDGSIENKLAFWDINQFITKRLNPKLAVSIGYKYRDLNEDIEQRLTQQVVYIHQRKYFRLVSRLRIEQRFQDEFAHRYRYRFSTDLPLNGLKLDAREFYLVASNEVLFERLKSSSFIDNRISLGTGYVISRSCKIQIDYTHRMEDLNTKTSHIPFLTTSLLFNAN